LPSLFGLKAKALRLLLLPGMQHLIHNRVVDVMVPRVVVVAPSTKANVTEDTAPSMFAENSVALAVPEAASVSVG
jgi:hypothetical protein